MNQVSARQEVSESRRWPPSTSPVPICTASGTTRSNPATAQRQRLIPDNPLLLPALLPPRILVVRLSERQGAEYDGHGRGAPLLSAWSQPPLCGPSRPTRQPLTASGLDGKTG